MKSKKKSFDLKKSFYSKNPVYVYGILDPYTAHVAKFVYNMGFSANSITIITFFIGIMGIASLFIFSGYNGLVIAAILIAFRNLGDTIDGKIARGSGTASSLGGFSDIVIDWLFFHAAFFIAIGFLTNHPIIGFLCVIGYMSREFARTKFTHFYGTKITETEDAKKITEIVSILKKYDLATVFLFIPIFLLINQPAFIIYFVLITEYFLLFGELAFDFFCLIKQQKIANKK